MKQTRKKTRTKTRSPGKKEKRKRAAKALAAAGAIAGGTQAYGAPVRFDNPPGPGHFVWTSSPGQDVLNIANEAGAQPGVFSEAGSFKRVPSPEAEEAVLANLDTSNRMQADNLSGYFFLVGASAGESIPMPGHDFLHAGFIYTDYYWAYYYAGVRTLLPEGEPTYLGVRFDPGDGTHYGWIGVVRTGMEFEAFAWGYETEAGVGIAAGAAPVTGACCGPGPCQEIAEADCEVKAGWKYRGDGTTCEEAACNNIPTVSEWGLLAMSLGMLAAGAWVVRKRMPQAKPPVA